MKIIRINALWCPACLISKTIWKDLEKIYKNIEYIDYDYDLDNNEITNFEVGDILPVVIVIKDNKEIKRLIGEKTKKEIIKELEEIYEENN